MMTTRWPPLAERLAHLADSFQQLKERVRDAVATEMGKVVADAIRDWITSALQARIPTRFRSEEAAFLPPQNDDGWLLAPADHPLLDRQRRIGSH